MESDTSSNYSESVDELLLEKDQIIDDLDTKVKILYVLNEILKDKIKDLQNVINSNLPCYLNCVLEFL